MSGRVDQPRTLVSLALVGMGTLVFWTWDVSWVASLEGSLSPGLPRWLAAGGCLVWSVIYADAFRGSVARITIAAAVLLLGVSSLLVDRIGVGLVGIEEGYLVGGGIPLSSAVGLLSVVTLHRVLLCRTRPESFLRFLAPFSGALVLLWMAPMLVEYVGWPNLWRGPEFCVVAGVLFGFPLAVLARASQHRFSATLAAVLFWVLASGVSMALYGVPVRWFSSGPAASHFVLLPVPLFLFIPSLAVDGLSGLRLPGPGWLGEGVRSLLIGGLFVGILWGVHWSLAPIFVDPGGVGRFLAAQWWPHNALGAAWPFEYWTLAPGRRRWAVEMVAAVSLTSVSVMMGLWFGQRYRSTPEPNRSILHDH